MFAFRLLLESGIERYDRNSTGESWSPAAGAVLSVFTKLIRPSLADTSGLSRGTIAAEPLLYAPSCASTPQGNKGSIATLLLQHIDEHNSSIHSMLPQQQPLLNAEPALYKDWLQAASLAASVVHLLYQASISNECLTSFDEQQGRCREFQIL
jgi:hypothetical protein